MDRRGFSLVELLLVVVLLTLLAAVLFAGLRSAAAKAREGEVCAFGQQVRLVLYDEARKRLLSPGELLAALGLPAASAPPSGGGSASWRDCGSAAGASLWGSPPAGVQCRVAEVSGQFRVVTWRGGVSCVDGSRP